MRCHHCSGATGQVPWSAAVAAAAATAAAKPNGALAKLLVVLQLDSRVLRFRGHAGAAGGSVHRKAVETETFAGPKAVEMETAGRMQHGCTWTAQKNERENQTHLAMADNHTQQQVESLSATEASSCLEW